MLLGPFAVDLARQDSAQRGACCAVDQCHVEVSGYDAGDDDRGHLVGAEHQEGLARDGGRHPGDDEHREQRCHEEVVDLLSRVEAPSRRDRWTAQRPAGNGAQPTPVAGVEPAQIAKRAGKRTAIAEEHQPDQAHGEAPSRGQVPDIRHVLQPGQRQQTGEHRAAHQQAEEHPRHDPVQRALADREPADAPSPGRPLRCGLLALDHRCGRVTDVLTRRDPHHAADPRSALTAAMIAPPSVTPPSDRRKLVMKKRWRR
jgi:hypothetical protein